MSLVSVSLKATPMLKPLGDILAYCLMPDHFHIIVLLGGRLKVAPRVKTISGELIR
jgi:REP element-mobilizing transposase RayT